MKSCKNIKKCVQTATSTTMVLGDGLKEERDFQSEKKMAGHETSYSHYEDRDEPIKTLKKKYEIHYSALYSTLLLCHL